MANVSTEMYPAPVRIPNVGCSLVKITDRMCSHHAAKDLKKKKTQTGGKNFEKKKSECETKHEENVSRFYKEK